MQNQTLIKIAKEKLKKLASELSEEEKLIFKKMYSHENLDLSINSAIDQMDSDKIDWAMTQVENTIKDK